MVGWNTAGSAGPPCCLDHCVALWSSLVFIIDTSWLGFTASPLTVSCQYQSLITPGVSAGSPASALTHTRPSRSSFFDRVTDLLTYAYYPFWGLGRQQEFSKHLGPEPTSQAVPKCGPFSWHLPPSLCARCFVADLSFFSLGGST